MILLLEKLIPIILIIGIGIFLRKTNILNQEIIEGVKKIIIQVGLPAVLFSAFGQAELETEYIYLFIIVFVLCIFLYAIGTFLHKSLRGLFPLEYTGGYFTGFEFGMVGIGLFSALWGTEQTPIIFLIGFGHELFIWFVYAPILEYRKTGKMNFRQTTLQFMKSPIIIAIFMGIFVNITKLYEQIGSHFVGSGILNGLNMLSHLVSPLILIVLGFSMTLKKIPLSRAIPYIFGRWIVIGIIGSLAIFLALGILPQQDAFFTKAFIAFLILPPPYILPLFMKGDVKEEQSLISDLLIYHTMTSFVGYIVLMVI